MTYNDNMSFETINKNGIVFMTAPNIDTTHAFTTRTGGVSSGIYKSLNLAQRAGDDPDDVKENYSLLCSALGISIDDIVCSAQVHGINIRCVSQEDRGRLFLPASHPLFSPYQADGLITNTRGVALMVYTADCVPILLYDPLKKAAGAVHAGWRGTAAGIAGIAVQKMVDEYGCSPSDIKAAIGPCISKCCFETDSDVADAVTAVLKEDAGMCISQSGKKYKIDLKEINRILLFKAGLTDITISDECTSCLGDKYWSHRKTQGHRGTQAAIIRLGS